MFRHWHRHVGISPNNPAEKSTAITRGTWLALIAMGLAVIILAQDFSAVNVALTSIEADLDTDLSTVQWVINAYALVFAMLIVAGGRLADMFGRKRIFLVGSTIFAAMSLLGGFSPNVYFVIAARAAMGIGGALMWPATLGMTYGALPPKKAGLAGGLIIGAAGIGQAIGPISGGALTQFLGWRWTLFINVPIAAIAMLVTWLDVHQKEPDVEQRIDYAGIVSLSVAIFALLFALDQATYWGWADWRILLSFAISGLLLVVFLLFERGMKLNALVPADIMKDKQFTAACLGMALVCATFVCSLLYLPQFMQKLLNYTPLQAGLGMLPEMAVFAVVSFLEGSLYGRLGPRLMVASGAACLAVGPFLVSLVGPESGYGALVPGMIVIGIGLGLFYASATTAGISALPPSRTSLAGGLLYMFQIAGGSIGLGLTTTVVALTAQNSLTTGLADLDIILTRNQQLAIHGLLAGTAGAQNSLAGLSQNLANQITQLVFDAFVAGIQNGFRLDALLAFAGFLITAKYIHGRKSPHRRK